MTPRRFGFVDFLLLVVVLAAAAGTRAGYLISCADGGRTAGPLLVQDPLPPLPGLPSGTEMLGRKEPTELDALVHNVKEHRWFGSLAPFADKEEATAHVAPGYPWLVGQLARFQEPDAADRIVRCIQVGLGTLTAVLYFLFARRAFHSRFAAFLTGLLCAVYPFWIVNTAAIDDGVLATFLLAASLFLGARASQKSGPFASLLYGLALAALSLVRAALLPFAFVAVAWFLLRSRRMTRGWLCAVLAFLGFVNGLAPWAIRNYRLFQELVPVVDSAHYHLWIGNNRQSTGGPASEEMLAAAPTAELQAIAEQPARYARLGREWWETVREQPVLATLKRRIGATLYFLLGERWFQKGQLYMDDDSAMPEWLRDRYAPTLTGTLMGLFVFAFLGWRWTYGWAAESMPMSLALIWGSLPYILGHAESLHGPRLPLDGVLLCYAAFALACLVPGVSGFLLHGATEDRPEDRK